MPLQATSGAASYDAFGGGVAAVPNYIEECFSTTLYTGNGSTQTITNGIDLSGKGGMVWGKGRSVAYSHQLYDTNRGAGYRLLSNTTDAQAYSASLFLTAFNSDGFSLGSGQALNESAATYASWTFRKQPKFFDVVTYTGDGNTTKDISHSLGSKPGWIILKKTSSTSNWATLANPTGNGSTQYYLRLNTTDSRVFTDSAAGNTSTLFRVTQYGDAVTGNSADNMNDSGATYVAYLFAHNAGGFGLTGTDNVISCGSFTTDGSGNATVSLGYEPQLILAKYSSQSSDWMILDSMRGMRVTGNSSPGNNGLFPNLSNAEAVSNATISTYVDPTSTGFIPIGFGPSKTIIYIAIRRGPMKVPTSGTSVFAPVAAAFNSTTVNNNGFVTDMVITRQNRGAATDYQYLTDRLRGANNSSGQYLLEVDGTYSEAASSGRTALTGTQTIQTGFLYQTNTTNSIAWSFGRAPSFFDEVCYTGTSATQNISHNLGVVPELMIIKDRTAAQGWPVYNSTQGNTKILLLNSSGNGFTSSTYWNSTTPTSSVFTVGTNALTNSSGSNFVAYLFATCAGVSKCTAFTGTGTLQTIDCGFTAGSRFVLIKRTDAAGDWYVWDSSRGLSSSTDPYLLLNSTAAEVTSTNWVDTTATGFQVTAASGNNVNINGASYIALAIA